MESLDQMSDDQLRVRLSQYGFPNLPVTDTTRKVLVKKLQKAIDGEKTKGRHETVAVSKFSSDEEPEKAEKSRGSKKEKTSNRRVTLANTKSLPDFNGSSGNGLSKLNSDPPNRRASRNTPAKERAPAVPQFVPVLEDTDDDIIVEVPTTKRRSTSRTTTPTMGKSETVRTSYATSVKPVDENSGEEIYSVDDEEEELPPPRIPVQAQTVTRRNTQSSSATTFTMKVQEKKTPSKLGRATLGTSYTPRTNYTHEDDRDDVEPIEFNESNAPYLSNFAKRLSTLSAEPLDAGMDKYKSMNKLPPTEYKPYQQPSSYNYSRLTPAPKPVAARQSRGFFAGLSQLFDAMDRQYNFYTLLYIILFVMLIVALIVVFM